MDHKWSIKRVGRSSIWLILDNAKDATVHCKPDPRTGKYLWSFRNVYSYADTISEAMEYVEAGAEFFDVMRHNPYTS